MEHDEDLEVSGPFGWKIKAGGRYITLMAVGILCTAALGYMLREHDLRQTAQLQEATELRSKQIEQVAGQQRQLMESMDTMIYVLTLSPEDRSKLKLDMPQSLRSRIINQERAR